MMLYRAFMARHRERLIDPQCPRPRTDACGDRRDDRPQVRQRAAEGLASLQAGQIQTEPVGYIVIGQSRSRSVRGGSFVGASHIPEFPCRQENTQHHECEADHA